MSDDPDDRTASLMTPAKLAQLKVRPQVTPSSAAWLDQMAADAGSGHVRRLADLRRQLETQVGEADAAGVASAAQALAQALEKVDYAQVEPRGWLARATGKGKEAATAFLAQYNRAERTGEDLADEVRALQKKQQAQGTGIERSLADVDAEVRAIEKIMDQGARWLQDMRVQLKTREAEGGDGLVQQQIREDTARCEVLVVRLKQLRGAISATQQSVEKCKGLAPRRAALQQGLQNVLDGEWKAWQERAAAVAEGVAASGSASDAVGAARDAQQSLAAVLRQVAADCASLQAQQQAVAGELVDLQASLQAVA
jgi:hypothetical protein